MTDYKHHLFICTNDGSAKSTCGGKGAKQLRDDLKKNLKKSFKKEELRVNQAGCLGNCKNGISAVLYPEGQWFLGLKKNDAKKVEKEVFKTIKKEEG